MADNATVQGRVVFVALLRSRKSKEMQDAKCMWIAGSPLVATCKIAFTEAASFGSCKVSVLNIHCGSKAIHVLNEITDAILHTGYPDSPGSYPLNHLGHTPLSSVPSATYSSPDHESRVGKTSHMSCQLRVHLPVGFVAIILSLVR